MHRTRIVSLLCPLFLLAVGCEQAAGVNPEALNQTADASADGPFTIGSPAPALTVDNWYPTEQENDQPITSFQSGNVYVVEFWATWCGPCVASIPHINDLQNQYLDRGVTFISLTDEDQETVEPFFKRQVRGAEGDDAPTYGELMSAYRVGSDPDGSVSESYMQAAGQSGIPCAFIVGKSGRVEWIGHPMAMDDVLEQVVEDQWDRAAFAKQFKLKQKMDLMMQQVMRALRRGDTEAAFATLDQIASEIDDPAVQQRIEGIRSQLELSLFYQQLGDDPQKDLEQLKTRVAGFDGDTMQINQFVWPLAAMSAQGKELDPALLRLAAELTEEHLEAAQPDQTGNVLDTIAHLYHASGDLDSAIERQTRAADADNPPEVQQEVDAFLKQLLTEQVEAEEAATPAAEIEE